MRSVYAGAVLAATLVVVSASPAASIQCRDESGRNVDWWAAFKFPNGYNYAYIDANSRGGLVKSSNTLDDASSGAMSHTIKQMYGDVSNYVWYDDEPPNAAKASSTFGHTKGFMGFTDQGGFWVIHSVPRFPDSTSSYDGYPADEAKYGQSFLCVSYPYHTFDQIGSLLLVNRPKVFGSQLSSSATSALPNLASFLGGTYNHNPYITNTVLTSLGGMPFTMFAKTHYWGQDLYNQGVSPYYKDDTYVESWMNGVGPLPTYCKPQYSFNTYDIRNLNITNTLWKETQDHSKWCILASRRTVCIGDINRQHGQLGRGGGTACFDHSELWHSLQQAITNADHC